MENQVETKERSLAFWLILLAALFFGVVGIFAMLELVVPAGVQSGTGAWNALYSKDGAPTAYTMRTLGEKDHQTEDVTRWLTASGDYVAQELGGDDRDTVFWLYRQDSDEYILCLPEQDREIAPTDVTANEEKDDDGSVRLVIRIRTDENAAEIEPGEQLLSFGTNSEKWNGIRVSVILDGRERKVRIMTSKDGGLFTAEESYIGRK